MRMLMDPVHLCIALGPVCVYLLLIGSINLSSRPFVTSGARDLLTLAIGISGLVAAGPLELFMPEDSAVFFRAWIWIPLMMLYFLVALLVSMVARPRIVVYNITADQLRPVLGSVAAELDSDVRWAGSSLMLPNLGVQLYVQSYQGMRNVQLVAAGGEQNLISWKHLERALTRSLKSIQVGMNPRGFSFVSVALILISAVAYALFMGRETLAERMNDFLRL